MRRSLSCAEVRAALDGWRGRPVAVRVVGKSGDLLAVFSGELGARSDEKHPALFWPIAPSGPTMPSLERPGIYLHPELVERANAHEGEWVLEVVQGGATLNIRRLDATGIG
jgi:hypothetical protein